MLSLSLWKSGLIKIYVPVMDCVRKFAQRFFGYMKTVWLTSNNLAKKAPLDNEGQPLHRGSEDLGMVAVEADLIDRVKEAADECPGECIFIEHD